MKKKIVIVAVVVICLAVIIAFAAKKDKEPEGENTVSIGEILDVTENKTEEKTEKETEEEKTNNKKEDPDKIVSVEIPLLFIDAEYQNDLDGFVQKYGYKSAKLNKRKNTVTVKMKAFSYDLYLTRMGIATIRAICETFDSESYPYVKNLGDYESNFSFVTLLVNGNEFKKATNIDDLFKHISTCCAFYLMLDEEAPDEFTIEIRGVKNKQLLATRSYSVKDFIS